MLWSACQSCCCYVTSSGELDHCQEDISEEALTARMRRLLEPFLLRRLKEQVASQLVPKQQEVCAIFHMLMHCRKQSQDNLACELATMPWITPQYGGCQANCVTAVSRSGGWR